MQRPQFSRLSLIVGAMDFEKAVATAPPGWTHFQFADLDRLPPAVRLREMERVPRADRQLVEAGDPDAKVRVLRAAFWSLVYHLEPHLWDELSRVEPIHTALLAALPDSPELALDIGAGSGRLTAHLVGQCRHVVAIEPSIGLRSVLHRRLPQASVVAGGQKRCRFETVARSSRPHVDPWAPIRQC